MPINIGIPQALLYHEFGSLWTNFFNHLRIPTTLSGKTNKEILDHGTTLAIDESCLPLKIYLGHIASLLPICTHIFVPRIAGYHKHFFLCAKFAGLPDIVKNTFSLSDKQLITPNIEDNHYSTQLKAISKTCLAINTPRVSGYLAYYQAQKQWKLQNHSPTPSNAKIALIGHSYLIKDSFFCHDILSLLEKRHIRVISPEHIPCKTLYHHAASFHPDIYWQLSAKIAGATHYFSQQPDIQGIIMVSSFCCGPDSLMNEYLEHHILKNSNKPYIIVTMDEHTGSAGIVTRIEAFLDLLDWRLQSCR
jgi:predicted nucleotide-binding protein (sugar kinase/HSP70/actin superfamily)